jgi:hypothetical protein
MARKKALSNDIEKQFLHVLTMNLEGCTTTVCLGSLSDNEEIPKLEQLQLKDDLTKEFSTAAKNILKHYSQLAATDDLIQRPYDEGSKPDSHEVESLKLADHGSIEAQVKSLSSLAEIPVFKIDDSFITGIRFYVIVFQCGNNSPLYFFRTYTSKKELSRSHHFAAFLSGGAFDSIKDPLFLFDHKIDALSYQGAMYVFNHHNFQKIFRFFELVAASAVQTLATIRTYVPIHNFDEFEAACVGHLQMQVKLKNIANKPYLEKLQIAKIKKALEEFPNLGLKTVKKNGKEMLIFDPKNKWALLRLLDDGYLDSVLTGEKYEVTGKRPYPT